MCSKASAAPVVLSAQSQSEQTQPPSWCQTSSEQSSCPSFLLHLAALCPLSISFWTAAVCLFGSDRFFSAKILFRRCFANHSHPTEILQLRLCLHWTIFSSWLPLKFKTWNLLLWQMSLHVLAVWDHPNLANFLYLRHQQKKDIATPTTPLISRLSLFRTPYTCF